MATFKSIVNKQEDDLLRKFKVKSKAKNKLDRWIYVHNINILSNVLHMSDDDVMRYFHKGIMLDGPVTYNCNVRKKLFDKYKLIGRHTESHYYGEDFGYRDDDYCLYENDKHLILCHECYMTGDGTDYWITLIR